MQISWLPTLLFQVTWSMSKKVAIVIFICLYLGFYSWRNTTNGSWFVQALCYVLAERGREEDLLSLMTTVSRIVAIGFESNTPQDSNMHQRKQIPCVTSLLTRKIYFKRKSDRLVWNKWIAWSEARHSALLPYYLQWSNLLLFFQISLWFTSTNVSYLKVFGMTINAQRTTKNRLL